MFHEKPNFTSTTGILQRFICPKFVFGRGSAPDPAWGAHDIPLGPRSGIPLPILQPLNAYCVLISARLEFHFLKVGNPSVPTHIAGDAAGPICVNSCYFCTT